MELGFGQKSTELYLMLVQRQQVRLEGDETALMVVPFAADHIVDQRMGWHGPVAVLGFPTVKFESSLFEDLTFSKVFSLGIRIKSNHLCF